VGKLEWWWRRVFFVRLELQNACFGEGGRRKVEDDLGRKRQNKEKAKRERERERRKIEN